MSRDRDETRRDCEEKASGTVVVAEAVRLSAPRPSMDSHYVSSGHMKSEEGMPLFWRVFGGTLLSIFALVCLTVYNQFTSSISDLRRDIVQLQDVRPDLIRKDDFNNHVSKLWTGIKELSTANSTLGAVNERLRAMDQQLEKQIKSADDDRKELRGSLEDLRKAHQQQGDELRKLTDSDRKDHHRDVEEVRKNSDVAFKDLSRKLEEYLKAVAEDRKELHKKIEEQLKVVSDERKELNSKLQALAERLATIEGRQTAVPAEKKAAAVGQAP